MVEHRKQLARFAFRKLRRSIHGEVAALRVPAEDQGPPGTSRHFGRVARRHLLGGHGRGVRHVEILAPPRPRVVGPPKRQVSEALRAGECHGGELGAPLLAEHAHVIMDDDTAETRAFRRCGKQLLHVYGSKPSELVVGKACPEQVGEAAAFRRPLGGVPPQEAPTRAETL